MAAGKIIKGIAGFYYVDVAGSGVYECKAKGIFRKEDKKPLVGDDVRIGIISEEEKTGNITEILPRRNELVRPASANVDQALVVFAVARPDPHLNLLDRFLVTMERQQVPVVICFNKTDLCGKERICELKNIYQGSDCPCVFVSAKTRENLDQLRSLLMGKTTVVAGPSGAGKSSLINLLCPEARMETGEISRKIARGKNTTRHAELFALGPDTYLMDTPGFSSLYVTDFDKSELKDYFPEFTPYAPDCRFHGCDHVNEPDCAVKAAVAEGKISSVRYEDYLEIYRELGEKKRY